MHRSADGATWERIADAPELTAVTDLIEVNGNLVLLGRQGIDTRPSAFVLCSKGSWGPLEWQDPAAPEWSGDD